MQAAKRTQANKQREPTSMSSLTRSASSTARLPDPDPEPESSLQHQPGNTIRREDTGLGRAPEQAAELLDSAILHH